MPWGKHRKVKMFSFSIENEIRKVDKDGNESVVTISYKKNINSTRFMASWLSNLFVEFTKLNAKIAIVFLNTKVSMTI